MKVLFLALEPPFPPNDGGRLRTFNILKQMAKRHSVTFVCFEPISVDPGIRAGLQPYCQNIFMVKLPAISHPGWSKKIMNLGRRFPVSLDNYLSEELKLNIRDIISKEQFDVVHIDQIYLAQYLDILSKIPCALTHHNVETLAQRRQLWGRPDRYTPRWGLDWLENYRWYRYELESSRRCDALAVVSGLERDFFQKRIRNTPAIIVPNGVDTEYFIPNHQDAPAGALLYTGRMDYPPNVDAMLWFCSEILPAIQRECPDATLTIVGRDPTPRIRNLSALPGVTVTGTVPDVRPFFANASIYIVPLRQGAGTRLKILEAMSMEMPIISTGIGCEGLELTDGVDFIRAEAQDFATQVFQLIENSTRRDALGINARLTATNRYEWAAIAQKQEEVYRTAIDQHRQRKAE